MIKFSKEIRQNLHPTKYLGLIILLTLFGCAKNNDTLYMAMAEEEVIAPPLSVA